MTTPTPTTPPTPAPTMPSEAACFLYDDCCALCKGYTAVFTGLGLASREGFSTTDQATLDALDLDKARHFIPLHDPASGTVRYGFDGILAVVGTRAPLLERFGRTRPVRAILESIYWLITYNRRHIVAAPPPATGFDCAPDHRSAPVRTYIAITAATAVWLALAADVVPLLAAFAIAGVGLAWGRDDSWKIAPEAALGHASTVTLAATGAAAIGAAFGLGMLATTGLGTVVGLRKLWLRRWMLEAR